MEMTVIDTGANRYAAGPPGQPLMRSVDDANAVLEFCFGHQVNTLLLYAENLPERFFDLSSHEAGLLLQKFRTYRIKLAVVADLASIPHSQYFAEMAAEEQRRNEFHLYASAAEAEAWLLHAGGAADAL